MLVLALAGAAAFVYITPISFAIAALLLIVIISYRQTIRAYPDGGGGFIVSLDNLGMGPAMVAGAALLTDYTLTVSVSVSAGVAAIDVGFSRAPPVESGDRRRLGHHADSGQPARGQGVEHPFRPPHIRLRGHCVRDADHRARAVLRRHVPPGRLIGARHRAELATISLFLILRAFASGSTALTGVEAIANGVQAFREPKAHNAATTLGIMGAISITMFLGISTLAASLQCEGHRRHRSTSSAPSSPRSAGPLSMAVSGSGSSRW